MRPEREGKKKRGEREFPKNSLHCDHLLENYIYSYINVTLYSVIKIENNINPHINFTLFYF